MFVLTEIRLWTRKRNWETERERERERRRTDVRECALTSTHSHSLSYCEARHHHRSFAAVWEFNQILCRFACRTAPAKRKLIEFTLLIESKNFNLFAFVGGTRWCCPNFLSLFFFLAAAAAAAVCVCVQKRVLAESLSDKCKSNLSLRFAVSLCLVLYISQIMWKKFEPFFALLSLSVSDFFLIISFFLCFPFSLARLLFDAQFYFYFIRHSRSQVFSRLPFPLRTLYFFRSISQLCSVTSWFSWFILMKYTYNSYTVPMVIELHKVLNLLWVIFSYIFSLCAAAPVLVSFRVHIARTNPGANKWTNVRVIFISMRGFCVFRIQPSMSKWQQNESECCVCVSIVYRWNLNSHIQQNVAQNFINICSFVLVYNIATR